jgi:hypothetical protein
VKKIVLSLLALCFTFGFASGQGIYVSLNMVNLDPNCGIMGISSSYITLPDSLESGSVNFQMAGALNIYNAFINTTAEAVAIGVCAAQDPACGGSYACTEMIVYANTSNVILLDFSMGADNDGDGYTAENDCDDTMASVNPGAEEICNDFLDNNCNGLFNEGCEGGLVDMDMDGYDSSVDCNDMDWAINPAMPEICADAVDNNCNGQIDEEGCTGGGTEGCNPEIILLSDSAMWSETPGVVWILFPFEPSNTMSFFWDFGDGNTSTDPFPTNIYDLAGTYTVCLTVMANGCVGTTCLTFTVTPEGDFLPGGMPMTGFTLNVVNAIPNNVSEVSANAILEAYPCPFNDELTLNIQSAIAGNAQVACYDMTGALIAQEQFVVSNQLNTYSIPTSSWSNGAYTIVVSTPSGTIRRVVMK